MCSGSFGPAQKWFNEKSQHFVATSPLRQAIAWPAPSPFRPPDGTRDGTPRPHAAIRLGGQWPTLLHHRRGGIAALNPRLLSLTPFGVLTYRRLGVALIQSTRLTSRFKALVASGASS